MGRHSADAPPSAAPGEEPHRPDAYGEYDTGPLTPVASASSAGFRRRVAAAAAAGVAMIGVVLLVFGVISLTQSTDQPSTNSQDTSSAAETPAETVPESTPAETVPKSTPAPETSTAPQSPAVLLVTVLNASPDLTAGLATRVAAALESGGWPIAELLNYSETQVPVTTVFFTPGNAAEEAAAQALVAQFPEIAGGAEPRFEGLDGSGLTLAAVGDWLP